MGYKLLSFLGPTKYIEAYYIYNKKSWKPCQFIQEALLEFFCKKWKDDAQVVIFLTEKSKQRNWLSKNECKDANFEKGLKKLLEEAKERLKLNITLKEVVIPEGKNEEELWEIFEKINDSIDKNDTLIFDITHSFRSLPMLTFVALNYVRFLKDAKIKQIVYGAMEALGPSSKVREMPLEKRVIPVLDLTLFESLFDWTIAVERFLKTGNAEMINKLGIEELKPLLAETKGEVGGGLRGLVTSLNSFSQNVLTCRAPDFRSSIKRILNSLPKAEKELERLRRFKPLFEKIKERFSDMRIDNEIICGLEVSSWCLEKGLIQQGLTILREAIINYVIINILESNRLKKPGKRKNTDYREIAEVLLNNRYEKIPVQILNLWDEIKEYRNDINHGGWREQNYHLPDDFKNKLSKFIERFRSFLQEEEINAKDT